MDYVIVDGEGRGVLFFFSKLAAIHGFKVVRRPTPTVNCNNLNFIG